MTKKLMALLLAVLMAVSLLPMPAMAGDAQVITDLSGISAGGSYVVDKSVKDIVLSAPLTLDKDVTLELTGQTVTLKLADGESYADASVFHVESGSLTLKGSGTVKVPDNASGVVVAKDAAVIISGEVGISGGASGREGRCRRFRREGPREYARQDRVGKRHQPVRRFRRDQDRLRHGQGQRLRHCPR